MNSSPQFQVDIGEIRKHYDRLSMFYRMLWGEHLHHGYWENGESIERAQIKLMEQLAEQAGIPRGAKVLDIGCGLGGSAFWLANQYNCSVTGLTISPVQVRIANKKAKVKGLADRVRFLVVDANLWQPEAESVDIVWIMESSEHLHDKKNFFERCARALRPGGSFCGLCVASRRTVNVGQSSRIGRQDWPGHAECKSRYLESIRRLDAPRESGCRDRERYYQKYRSNVGVLFPNRAASAAEMVGVSGGFSHPPIREVVPTNDRSLCQRRNGVRSFRRQEAPISRIPVPANMNRLEEILHAKREEIKQLRTRRAELERRSRQRKDFRDFRGALQQPDDRLAV